MSPYVKNPKNTSIFNFFKQYIIYKDYHNNLEEFKIILQISKIWNKFAKNWNINLSHVKHFIMTNICQIFSFRQKFFISTKIWQNGQNLSFLPKFVILTRICHFDQNLSFWLKFVILTKICHFDQDFFFWQKLSNLSSFYENRKAQLSIVKSVFFAFRAEMTYQSN